MGLSLAYERKRSTTVDIESETRYVASRSGTASITLTADRVGTTRVSRKPPRCNSSPYSSAVRSMPPAQYEHVHVEHLAGWGSSPDGRTISTSSSRPSGSIVLRQLRRIATQRSSSQS